MDALHEKKTVLVELLRKEDRIMIAFSGGVDSTFLLEQAVRIRGEYVTAVTMVSPAIPAGELAFTQSFCREHGIEQILLETQELTIAGFAMNPPNRCYLCKRAFLQKVRKAAEEKGIPCIMEGSNVDDDADYRPGAAALKELGIRSPLKEAGLTKADIRMLSKEDKLPTWNKPSMACLYSRFAYGEQITEQKLSMVARAEELLCELGFTQVRVRLHGNLARIETDLAHFEKLACPETAGLVSDKLKKLGFSYVTMDLFGYRTGSMNETLEDS